MAMRLGITPTFHLSCRLRLLRLESFRQFSTSYSSLVRLTILKRNLQFPLHNTLPRLGLWRRSIAAVSSGPSGEGEDTADARESKNKRSVAYDLSSGFLQTRRQTEKIGLRNLAQDEDTEDWEKLDTDFLENPSTFSLSRRGGNNKPRTSGVERNRILGGADYGTDYSNSECRSDTSRSSKKNIISSSDEDSDGEWLEARSRGIRSRREEDVGEDPDEGFGDWTGSAEPSKNFKKSSLYKQSLEDDVKPQYQNARSVRYSPLPSPSGGAAKPPKSSSRKLPQSNSKASSSSSLPESATKAEFDFSSKSSSGTDLSDFIPPVIKPELPYQYSYTETPNVAPLGFREPVYSPFGPEGVNRPWTGRPPLAKSKKKPREFDSFNPPPFGKKGVKPVQQPGPFPEGQEPELGRSREEIMGDPLTEAEVNELIMKARKEDRQLNLGRDGLTHNMLDLVHQHWKRRRVCKIKCKGVPTVDMDNVCRVLEEKSGGKIILRAGGSVYLFRGRNYNYKTRPKIPLMLWKPPAPIYPKLIEKTPAGLTVEEANNLRKLGRQIPPICHLGKNGVYMNLVRDVQNAFRYDDLVKVDCKNMNPSDFKKIGAKLKDLVPCILLSFERESILMWKGPKSSVESPDGVAEDNSGESTPPFRRELPEDGQEFLEKTLLNEDNIILDSAENGISQEDEERTMYDSEESSIEVDHDFEAAYDQDNEQDDEQESSQEEEDADLMTRYEAMDTNVESDVEFDVESDVESSYHDEKPGLPSAGDSGSKDKESEEAIRVFESLYQDALDSSEAFILDELELHPDTLFEVVKSHFGGAYGAPAKPRNKRNSNEVVGRKALLRSTASRVRDEDDEDEEGKGEGEPKRQGKKKPLKGLRLDPSVLDRVPTDASGLLQVDELARLLAP